MKTQYAKTNGAEIFVSLNEFSKGRETILFAHGFPDDHRTWSKQIEILEKDFNVAALDLRGVGKSTGPSEQKGYSLPFLVEDYQKVIDSIGGPVHLVAHDWGAIIGWVFITDPASKNRIKSYTAISCPDVRIARANSMQSLKSLQAGEIYKVLRQGLKSWYMFFFQIPRIPEFLFKNMTLQLWSFAMTQGGLPPDDEMRFLTESEIIDITENAFNLYRELLQNKPLPLPDPCRLPVQILIPDNDLAILPHLYDHHEDFYQNMRSRHFDCNHWVHRERPTEISRLIQNFVLENSG